MTTHSTFLPEKPHGQRSLVGYSPWGHRESDTTEPPSVYASPNSSLHTTGANLMGALEHKWGTIMFCARWKWGLYPCSKQSLEVGQLRRMCLWLSKGDTYPEGADVGASPFWTLGPKDSIFLGAIATHWECSLPSVIPNSYKDFIILIYKYPMVEHWIVMNFLLF